VLVAVALVVVVVTSFAGVGRALAADPTAIVSTGKANVRSGPGPGYPVVATLSLTDPVTLLGRTNDSSWAKVRTAAAVEGWMSTLYLKSTVPFVTLPVLAQASPWGLVISPVINMRTGPGVEFGIVGTLTQGQYVTLLGRNATGTWLKIMANGVEGWVNSANIASSVPISSLLTATTTAVPVTPTAVPTSSAATATAKPAGTAVPTVPAKTPVPASTAVPSNTAVVTTGRLNVRSGPGAGYTIVAVLTQGDIVTLLGRTITSSWVKIKTAGGVEGWISTFYILANMPVSSLPSLGDAQPSGIIIAGTANLRVSPSITAAVKTTLNQGTIVGVLARSSDGQWVKVSFNGLEGWVGAGVIASSVPISSLPVAAS
jgi:N-acetylmuramoyl-L-alanine amidase